MKKYLVGAILSMMIVSGVHAMQPHSSRSGSGPYPDLCTIARELSYAPFNRNSFTVKDGWLYMQALVGKGFLAYLVYQGVRRMFGSKKNVEEIPVN